MYIQPYHTKTEKRISSSNPEYKHILWFRRSVFIYPPETRLPDSILITHDNTNYKIFLSTDNLCFHCKQHEHFSHTCIEALSQSNSINNISYPSNFPPIPTNQANSSQLINPHLIKDSATPAHKPKNFQVYTSQTKSFHLNQNQALR